MARIDTDDAREIASHWYSPRAVGLTELATCRRRPISDAGMIALLREVDQEIDEVSTMRLTSPEDLDELVALRTWAEGEADLRGLR